MSRIYSSTRDLTAQPARVGGIKPQDTPADYSRAKMTRHHPLQPAPVPALFSGTRPGVDPMTGRAW